MITIHAVCDMQRWADAERAAGRTIGFVPTMGALHEGHLTLARRARRECDRVVASVFVNPTQFGPNEDFDRYPRVEDRDQQLLRGADADVCFLPALRDMYPGEDRTTWVTVEGVSAHWCGASRPGFFRGVATVVSKLFHAVKPHRAYFGEKDFQQLSVIRRMVQELLFDVEIVGVPTVREADGLAMSSRNQYLDAAARDAAPGIYRALCETQASFAQGSRDAETLLAALRRQLAQIPGARLDYAGLAAPGTLAPIEAGPVSGGRLLVAVHVGGTRLIDNLDLNASPAPLPAAVANP